MLRWIAAHRWAIFWGFFVLLVAALVAGRLYLNVWLPRYVNQVLNRVEGYQGSVADIDIDLYRGAYRIYNLRMVKKTGNIPTPFLDIETIDLSIQWSALLDGRIVSNAELYKPVINFAINRAGNAAQTGAGADWTQAIKDLMPIDINRVRFSEGRLTYQDFSKKPKVNIYIRDMSGEARNLRNVEDQDNPLPSTFVVRGNSIGNGRLQMKGRLNILKEFPDMDLDSKLENVYLPALSDYSNAYAAVDIKDGNLNLYSELAVKNGQVSGYVKPIATNVSLIDLRKPTNPVKLVWEVLVAAVVEIFTNQSHDQFATKIPLEGSLKNIDTDTWGALVGIVRNAFVEAVKKGFEGDIKPKRKIGASKPNAPI